MTLLARLLWKGLTLKGRRPLEPLGTSALRFRVWPNDLDVNLHMNNGRFLSVMDLGRFDLVFRTGLGGAMVRNRWKPLVGGLTMRYRRSLGPFASYELHTRLLGWDAKWFFMEQRFLQAGELAAEGVVRALFRGREGNVPTAEVLRPLGYGEPSPALPEAVRRWAEGLDNPALPEVPKAFPLLPPVPEGYRISFDLREFQFDVIHRYLARSYWSPGIPREVVEQAARHSLCVGVFGSGGAQVGFARMATDRTTFAYLADVFVLEEHRGQGLSAAMVRALMNQPEVQGMRRLMLATRDAHGLYAKLGWSPVTDPAPFMQVHRRDLYQSQDPEAENAS